MQHSLLGWGDGILALVRLSGADRAYRCPTMGSIVATEVCLCRTTESELGLIRRTGKPLGEGITKALATPTGRCFVRICSRMHGCTGSGHTESFWLCTHASTSNSQAGGILTVSTRETVRGEVAGS